MPVSSPTHATLPSTWSPPPAATAHAMAFMTAKRNLLTPQLQRTEDGLLCNGILIPFSQSPLTKRLFDAFLDAASITLGREELIGQVYLRRSTETMSQRMRVADRQNLIKLISRAREMASAYVNAPDFRWIEWFPYDQHQSRWSLYSLTRGYLEAKEWQILRDWPASAPH